MLYQSDIPMEDLNLKKYEEVDFVEDLFVEEGRERPTFQR